jgi:hypothetical protein
VTNGQSPPKDHFLPADFAGFTEAATASQRLAIVRIFAGVAYATIDTEVPMPNFEQDAVDAGFGFEWEFLDEDRHELTEEQIMRGARIVMLGEGKRLFYRLRDPETQRIVFQAKLDWIITHFAPQGIL